MNNNSSKISSKLKELEGQTFFCVLVSMDSNATQDRELPVFIKTFSIIKSHFFFMLPNVCWYQLCTNLQRPQKIKGNDLLLLTHEKDSDFYCTTLLNINCKFVITKQIS